MQCALVYKNQRTMGLGGGLSAFSFQYNFNLSGLEVCRNPQCMLLEKNSSK